MYAIRSYYGGYEGKHRRKGGVRGEFPDGFVVRHALQRRRGPGNPRGEAKAGRKHGSRRNAAYEGKSRQNERKQEQKCKERPDHDQEAAAAPLWCVFHPMIFPRFAQKINCSYNFV